MKDIKGFEGRYAVTKEGNVWSYPKKWLQHRKYGHTGMFLNPVINRGGYEQVVLHKEKERFTWRVHQLIASTFIANPESLIEVNHKNGNKRDNRVENLEWCTRGENTRHAIRTGLSDFKGEKNASARLTEKDVREIRKIRETIGMSMPKLGAKFGVSERAISFVLHRRTWKHVS